MCKLLSEWRPSKACIDLIKLNGLDDRQIDAALSYLKSQNELDNIDDIEGYDNWNSLFIMFCIKTGNTDTKA
ncbi:MAG: hypothetical protein OEY36_03625 [Gammaproteobacteria bacterium]|nr:hypothetical protein [Gammaproteobacteria bacterium]